MILNPYKTYSMTSADILILHMPTCQFLQIRQLMEASLTGQKSFAVFPSDLPSSRTCCGQRRATG